MKFFLTIIMCSVWHNNCLPVSQDMHTLSNIYDTFSSCIKDGLGQSFEVFFNSDFLKEDQINSGRLYPKFTCNLIIPESAESSEPA